jgi:uncharacterized membrane protein
MNSSSMINHRIACLSLAGLILLGIVWETWLAPYKPGNYLFVIKVIPLLFPLRGVFQKNIYTMQWASMFIMFYFMEGVVRAMGDADPISRMLAGIEIVLSISFFISSIYFVRPYKKIAKAAKKEALAAEKAAQELNQ